MEAFADRRRGIIERMRSSSSATRGIVTIQRQWRLESLPHLETMIGGMSGKRRRE